MIYFDNAATGGFKPSKSYEAAEYALKNLNANPGRSGHRLSVAASQSLYSARKSLAKFFRRGVSRTGRFRTVLHLRFERRDFRAFRSRPQSSDYRNRTQRRFTSALRTRTPWSYYPHRHRSRNFHSYRLGRRKASVRRRLYGRSERSF